MATSTPASLPAGLASTGGAHSKQSGPAPQAGNAHAMWAVTAANGFLPLMRPLVSWTDVLPPDAHGSGLKQSAEGLRGEPNAGQPTQAAQARVDPSASPISSTAADYVSSLHLLEALASSMPSLLADMSDPSSFAHAVSGSVGLPMLSVEGLMEAIEEARAAGARHPLAALAALPRAVVLHALFRDYSLLASAYVHEPRGKALRQLAPWEDGQGQGQGQGQAARKPEEVDTVKARADALSAGAKPRDSLPPTLAVPLVALSKLTGLPPLLEYTSYCLGTHTLAAWDGRPLGPLPGLPPTVPGQPADPALKPGAAPVVHPGTPATYTPASWRWQDLRLTRPMDGGTNEGAFILMHAEIEAHTPALVRDIHQLLEGGLGIALGKEGAWEAGGSGVSPAGGSPSGAAGKPITTSSTGVGSLHPPSPAAVASALDSLTSTVRSMLVSQLKMFNCCDPHAYEARTRPWIFGWKGNEDLPGGLLYRGVSDAAIRGAGWGGAITEHTAEGVRLSLRGETGAQSTIIPSLDIILGVTHRGDALKAMLVELEEYRPTGHRQWLRALRAAVWGDATVPAGGAPGGATGSRGYQAAVAAGEAPAPAHGPGGAGLTSDPVAPAAPATGGDETDTEAPHALRDWIRSTGDRALVRSFNTLVQAVWAFRSIHVAYSDLYIARVTAREGATGGTPYKAYLRKHRDETRMHQIWDGPGGAEDCMLVLPHTPATAAAFAAEVESVLAPGATNAIPPHLMTRHAADIERYGGGDRSLFVRCW